MSCGRQETKPHLLRRSPIPVMESVNQDAHEEKGMMENTRAAKDSDEFAGAATIITNRDDVAQGAGTVIGDVVEDIDQAVGSTSAGENNDTSGLGGGWRRRW